MEKSNLVKYVNLYYIEYNTVPKVIEGYKQFFKQMFEGIGYKVNIILSTQTSEPTESSHFTIIDEAKIDIIVSDIILGSKTYAGLDIIKQLKKKYPEIPIIAFSESNITYMNVSSKIPSFDLLIHKAKKNDKDYLKYMQNQICELFKVNVVLEIDYSKYELEEYVKDLISRSEFERLLKRITFTTHSAPINTCVAKVELEKITGGYSGSKTFRMYSKTVDGQMCINSILKISAKKYAKQEVENYYNYASWYLPYTWRPEMISYVMGNNIGIICYSFAYDDQSPFCSLTDHIQNNRVKKIALAIDKIFKPSNQRWYSNINKLPKDMSINEYYFDKYFNERDIPILEFQRIAKLCGVIFDDEYMKYEDCKYPMPSLLTSRDFNNRFQQHICHGDLNSNNILISNDDSMIFIDFQDTGLGHVFLDFIVFETCLKIYYRQQNLVFSELVELEKKLSILVNFDNNILIGNNMFALMHKIRKYAYENSPEEEKINYFFGITACAYKLLRLPLEDWQKIQLVACMLANLPIIENITNKE